MKVESYKLEEQLNYIYISKVKKYQLQVHFVLCWVIFLHGSNKF